MNSNIYNQSLNSIGGAIFDTVHQIGEKSEGFSTIEWVIFIIVIIASIIISITETGLNVVDDVVDAATVGVGGIATNTIDIIATIILETLQVFLMSATIYYLATTSTVIKVVSIALIIIIAITNVVLSIFGYLPYFDFVETGIEVFMEIAQNTIFALNFTSL